MTRHSAEEDASSLRQQVQNCKGWACIDCTRMHIVKRYVCDVESRGAAASTRAMLLTHTLVINLQWHSSSGCTCVEKPTAFCSRQSVLASTYPLSSVQTARCTLLTRFRVCYCSSRTIKLHRLHRRYSPPLHTQALCLAYRAGLFGTLPRKCYASLRNVVRTPGSETVQGRWAAARSSG